MKFRRFLENQIQYPIVRGRWNGMEILPVGSTSSIDASLYNWEALAGIRDIPYSEFSGDPKHTFYAANDKQRSRDLAEEIRQNQQIEPLIVVVDDEGPYILEGGHRFVALHILGYKSLPALVVIDED